MEGTSKQLTGKAGADSGQGGVWGSLGSKDPPFGPSSNE